MGVLPSNHHTKLTRSHDAHVRGKKVNQEGDTEIQTDFPPQNQFISKDGNPQAQQQEIQEQSYLGG